MMELEVVSGFMSSIRLHDRRKRFKISSSFVISGAALPHKMNKAPEGALSLSVFLSTGPASPSAVTVTR